MSVIQRTIARIVGRVYVYRLSVSRKRGMKATLPATCLKVFPGGDNMVREC